MGTNRVLFGLKTHGALLALVSAAFSQSALANSGHVDFAIGNVVVTDAKGQARTVAKGIEVGTGDKISSGADGRAQIRFSDGAYVSLQPNTEFDIKQYHYDGKADGTESALFGLFKGAMRTVTGLVGRINKNRYQISTPTATIGIRGTGGLIAIGNDGSTLVTGTSGIWTLSNNGGTLNVPAGTAGFAGANVNVPPQPANEGPVVPPAHPTVPLLPPYIQGDAVNAQGTPASIISNPPLVSGSGYALTGFLDTCGDGCMNTTTASPVDAIFDSAGRLTQFTDPSIPNTSTLDVANGGTYGTKPDGTQDFGTLDGVIAWGRWIGPVLNTVGVTDTFGPDQGLHFVVGIPTPVASLPTANTTFTYNLAGATAPTYDIGGVAPGTVTGGLLTANFVSGVVAVNLSASDGNGVMYSGSAGGRMNPTVPGAVFTASGGANSPNNGCPNVCSFSAIGFFAGTGASHAGVSYEFSNTAQGNLVGAAAFKR